MPKNLTRFSRTIIVLILLVPSALIVFGAYDGLGKEHDKQQAAKQNLLKRTRKQNLKSRMKIIKISLHNNILILKKRLHYCWEIQ